MRGFEGKILAANYGRTNNIPTFGICFGFQAMCVEYARNVMDLKDAISKEFADKVESKNYVIDEMPDAQNNYSGGTQRRGIHETLILSKDTLAY